MKIKVKKNINQSKESKIKNIYSRCCQIFSTQEDANSNGFKNKHNLRQIDGYFFFHLV
jgi:hypothetical protein